MPLYGTVPPFQDPGTPLNELHLWRTIKKPSEILIWIYLDSHLSPYIFVADDRMIGMPDAAAQDAAKDQQGQKAGRKPARQVNEHLGKGRFDDRTREDEDLTNMHGYCDGGMSWRFDLPTCENQMNGHYWDWLRLLAIWSSTYRLVRNHAEVSGQIDPIPGVVKATKVASQEDLRWCCWIFAGQGPASTNPATKTSDPAWFLHTKSELENGWKWPIEIVDLPFLKLWWIFPYSYIKRLPEGITAMNFHVFRTGQEWHDDYDILWETEVKVCVNSVRRKEAKTRWRLDVLATVQR